MEEVRMVESEGREPVVVLYITASRGVREIEIYSSKDHQEEGLALYQRILPVVVAFDKGDGRKMGEHGP